MGSWNNLIRLTAVITPQYIPFLVLLNQAVYDQFFRPSLFISHNVTYLGRLFTPGRESNHIPILNKGEHTVAINCHAD